jgi:hypothetical protein
LVKAILIVVPGFVLDRLRGRTGIVGGIIASSILGVVWGISLMEFPGQDPSGNFVAVAPALYFIFVVSLL